MDSILPNNGASQKPGAVQNAFASQTVVLGAAGAATPEPPDPVTSGDIDVQWAMTFDLGTSETGGPDSDGAKATGQVDDGPESRDGDSGDT